MPKKKRYRSRSGGSGGSGGNYSNSGRGGNNGGGGGGRRGGRRRRNSGPNSNNEPFPEPQVDENGEIPLLEFTGLLEMHPNGYGFLRSAENNYSRERSDPFVPGTMIEKLGLREGLLLHGMVQRHRKQQGPREPQK